MQIRSFAGIAALLLGSAWAYGQSITGSITGTNARTSMQTDSGGNNIGTLLPRGTYQLEVAAQARLDVQLMVGELAESVVDSADALRLEKESSTLAKVVDNKAIVNVPLNTRRERQAEGAGGSALERVFRQERVQPTGGLHTRQYESARGGHPKRRHSQLGHIVVQGLRHHRAG